MLAKVSIISPPCIQSFQFKVVETQSSRTTEYIIRIRNNQWAASQSSALHLKTLFREWPEYFKVTLHQQPLLFEKAYPYHHRNTQCVFTSILHKELHEKSLPICLPNVCTWKLVHYAVIVVPIITLLLFAVCRVRELSKVYKRFWQLNVSFTYIMDSIRFGCISANI